MTTAYQYAPTPGVQQPQKYPGYSMGPNYQKYGEQANFYYDPVRDHYDTPAQHAQKLAQQQAADSIINPPKPAGLAETLGPVAGVGLTLAAAKPAGEYLASSLTGTPAAAGVPATPGLLSQLGTGVKGLFGFGEASAPTAATAATAPAGMVQVGTALDGSAMMAPSVAPAAAAPGGMFSLGGIGTAGNMILPAAGAFGAYDVLSHGSEYSPTRAGLEGAASGAAIGSTFGPPGAVIGAGVGGLIGLGSSLTGGHDHGKVETKRLQKLSDDGTFIPPELLAASPTHARSKAELVQIAQQTGTPQDVKFAESRNINDLKGSGQSIVGYSTFAKQDPDWFKRPHDQQVAYANQLLDQGVVKEHNGTIDIDWNKAVKPPWQPAVPTPVVAVAPPPVLKDPTKSQVINQRGLMGLGV